MNQPTNPQTGQINLIISMFFILWGIYVIISSVFVYNNTGLLIIKTNNTSSVISVSALYHSASLIGTGNSKSRLVAGKYLVMASSSGKSANGVVVISNKKRVYLDLDLSKSNTLPSIYNINFSNSSYLINQGISNGQLGLIEKSLFSFKPNAKNITFINNSASYAPYDPNTSTSFTMYFNLSIDSVTYKASMNYSSLNSIDLSLYNNSSNKVFDSGTVSF